MTETLGDQIRLQRRTISELQSHTGFALVAAGATNATIAAQSAKDYSRYESDGLACHVEPRHSADCGCLPDEFGSTGPQTDDIQIRGDSGHMGIAADRPDGSYWAVGRSTCQFAGDDQSITAVLGSVTPVGWEGDSPSAALYLQFHCDAGFSKGAYCRIDVDCIDVGSFVRSGSLFTYTSFGTVWQGKPGIGERVEARNCGTAYTVFVNGNEVLSAQDSGALVDLGENYRHWAMTMERATVDGTVYDSYRVASLTMADYARTNTVPVSGCRQNNVATPLTMWVGTQVEYDAFGSHDDSTVYVIVG